MPAGTRSCSAWSLAISAASASTCRSPASASWRSLALTSRGTPGLTDPDDIPEAPEQPATVLGDVWLLGSHRLICGDSTNAADVERVLDGVKPHLCVTDPPYGVEYDPAWREDRGIASEGLAKGTVLNDDRADWREAWALFPGDVVYCWHAALQSAAFVASLEAVGFEIRAQIIWDKTRLVIGRGDYHWQHEPAGMRCRKGKNGHWAGDRKQTTIWSIPHRKSRHRPRHPKAGRMHAPADREQLLARPGGLRAVLRIGHHDHRRRDDGPRAATPSS